MGEENDRRGGLPLRSELRGYWHEAARMLCLAHMSCQLLI